MSNKIHNGNARRKFLNIQKMDANNNNVTGYPKVYSILDAFTHPSGNEPQITAVQFANLNDSQYISRLNKFVERVRTANAGIEVDIPDLKVGSIGNEAMCNISVVVPPGGAVTDTLASVDDSSNIGSSLVKLN